MKRPVREADGLYHIRGKTYKQVRGSRVQVWHGTALKTEGGLVKKELTLSHGRIVSLKKHKTAKKEKRLQKYGYFAEKGKFGYVKKAVRKSRKNGGGAASYPSAYDSPNAATASVDTSVAEVPASTPK